MRASWQDIKGSHVAFTVLLPVCWGDHSFCLPFQRDKGPSHLRCWSWGINLCIRKADSKPVCCSAQGPVLQISSRRALEQEREKKESMKAPQHSADGAPQQQTQRETQGRRSQEASHEAATEFRDVGTPTQPCKRHSSATAPQNSARDTAEQEERTQHIASVIENLTPFAEAMTQRSWRTDQTERTRYLICYCCPESEAAR